VTYNPMQDLTDFHDKFDRDGKARHARAISISLLQKRRKLIKEEYGEVIDQLDYVMHLMLNEDTVSCHTLGDAWVDLAKEFADLLYVTYGSGEELNMDLEAAFNTVHQSNMDKLWPDGQVHYNEYGKVIKPPTYTPPDLGHVFYDWN